MPDLVVDTAALRSAARALSTVASIAESLAGDHGRASALVPALGSPRPVQAASSFVSEWAYGSGWIATQATQAGANLTTTAATYEAIETILSAAVTGHVSSAPLVPVPPPVVEPMRPVPHFGSRSQLFPVQLATARHVSELIPGDPDLSTELGRRLLGFSVQLADARLALAQVSLGTWVGASARAAAADLEELAGRLNAAENAFATAGDAISVYARVHSDARAQAAQALAMWQAAEPAAKILRGAAVGPLPVGAPADPEAELARAGMLAREAQEMIATAGKALAERLEEAEHGAPNDPGWFSRLRRAVTSFVVGTAEGVWGMGEGVVALAALAVRANPARAVYDPQGYLASGEALWSAIEHGATHPGQVGAALIDLETWKDDPFRAAGRLVPDLIAIVGTAGAVGAARGAQATERLRTAAEVVEAARWRGTSNSASGVAAARLGELGLDPSSIVGRAAGTQLESLGLTVDRWMPTTVEPGQRFAMRPGSDIAVAVGDHLPWAARTFFEWQQSSPVRGRMADGSVTPPMYAEEVVVFEVRTPIDAASAIARRIGNWGREERSLRISPACAMLSALATSSGSATIDSTQEVWKRRSRTRHTGRSEPAHSGTGPTAGTDSRAPAGCGRRSREQRRAKCSDSGSGGLRGCAGGRSAMTDQDEREYIPAGKVRPISWIHLVPIARFLIEERGHLPIHQPERWGFTSSQSGGLFQLSRRITEEDWEALNSHFVIPPNIWFHKGLIRDQDNGVDFLGFDEVIGLEGVEPIEIWEAKERARPRTYGEPDLGERYFDGS